MASYLAQPQEINPSGNVAHINRRIDTCPSLYLASMDIGQINVQLIHFGGHYVDQTFFYRIGRYSNIPIIEEVSGIRTRRRLTISLRDHPHIL